MLFRKSQKLIVFGAIIFFLSASIAWAANKNLVWMSLLLGGTPVYNITTDSSVDSSTINLILPRASGNIADELIMQTFSVSAETFEQSGGLIMADNQTKQTALLGYRIEGDASQTEVSLRSSATALILMIAGSTLGADEKRAMVNEIHAHIDFPTLVVGFEEAFAIDPYFLESIGNNTTLVTLIKTIATDITTPIVVSPLSSLPTMAASVPINMVTVTPINYWENDQWGETWKWYPYNYGIATFDPPFMAKAESGDRVAFGNPTLVNYIATLYGDDGAEINWFMVPRNSTLFQKTIVNGWAVKRELSIGTEIDQYAQHIVFERTTAVNGLNTFHLFTGILGVVGDAAVLQTLAKQLENASVYIDAAGCLISLASTVDFTTNPEESFIQNFLTSNLFTTVETTITGCIVPLLADYLTESSSDIIKMITTSSAKIAGKMTPAGWALLVFDANNELAPFVLSWAQSDDYIGYDLTWTSSPALIDVSHNDEMPYIECGPIHLDFCSTESTCITAGGYWYNNACNQNSQDNITISYPSSSDAWKANETDTYVEWEGATGTQVQIELYKNGIYIELYHDWTANDGRAVRGLALPATAYASNYQLKVIDDMGNYGWSDFFAIVDPSLCTSDDPSLCVTLEHCVAVGGYWFDETWGCIANQGSPNYVDNTDGTVTETSSGLMWQKADSAPNRYTYYQALSYCSQLELAGHMDWRSPTASELASLLICTNGSSSPCNSLNDNYAIPTLDPVFLWGETYYYYWSSSGSNRSYTRCHLGAGSCNTTIYTDYEYYYVKCVR